jgi:hypothetical protein
VDELFLLPSAPVAMPRAYWLDQPFLSSQLVLVEPSTFEFARIQTALSNHSKTDFDMEIVNNLYGDSCFIIPHRRYDLLTGEFKRPDHSAYLGSKEEVWDPRKIMNEANSIHFSDWPFPKPWIYATDRQLEEASPKCVKSAFGAEDCEDRDMWLWV